MISALSRPALVVEIPGVRVCEVELPLLMDACAVGNCLCVSVVLDCSNRDCLVALEVLSGGGVVL